MKEFHLCKVIILFACLYEYKCRSFYFWSLDHKKSSKGPFLVFRHGYYLLQCLPMCLTLARYAAMQTELKTGRGGRNGGPHPALAQPCSSASAPSGASA